MLGLGFKTLSRTCTRIFFSVNQQTTCLFGFVKIFFSFFLFFFLSHNRKNRILKTKETFFFSSFQKIESFFFPFRKQNFSKHKQQNFKIKEIFFFFLSENKIPFFFPLENKNNQKKFSFRKTESAKKLKNKFLFFFTTKPNTNNEFPFFFPSHPNQSPTSCGVKKFCLKIVRKLLERINKTKISTFCRNLGKQKPNVWTFQASQT